MKSTFISILCLVCMSGCSVFDMTPIKSPHDNPYKCTYDFTPPVVDTFIAAGGAALTTLAVQNALTSTVNTTGNSLVDNKNLTQTNIKNDSLIVGSAVFTALFGTSAVYGYDTASECEVARYRYEHAKEVQKLQIEQAAQAREQQDRIQEENIKKEEAASIERSKKEEEDRAALQLEQQKFKEAQEQRLAKQRECEETYTRRADSARKLQYHQMVQQWFDDNKKECSITRPQQYIDNNGIVQFSRVVVGTQACWPLNRPKKMNGNPISDQDISNGNYATEKDSVSEWLTDAQLTDSCLQVGFR